ncbi:hypothetical protein ACWT_4643 [Actinoplanes sp. SE50]|uniref:hypothetical protein n=1 Tax=unclassified Actinoplanes TaxID=2626549 RepID=UPI00023ED643|nr:MULTISPECIES: hypothetical protein [unclassified Actinoplanes]AEV85665.1 hypothetical protein ACPL_4774 [Actinoplanes sp. SE50/110]ATO84058.1 hypothetical protein ACWT_4643 [Actinoplanes sp. SE50]SLM01468.1 hypothetical protein ACSP50_4704 [Actinoplanes sp. SE50/110]
MTASLVDRVVRWNLDIDGQLYGDERERYRSYEGIVTAATLHSILIPWAAGIMVWPLGRPAVLPLAVVLFLLWAPMVLCSAYVARRKAGVDPRGWSAKRTLIATLSVTPYAVFVVGAMYAFDPAGDAWIGAIVGSGFGAMLCLLMLGRARRRQALAAAEALAADEDED